MGSPSPVPKAFASLGRMKLHVIDLIARQRVDLTPDAVGDLKGGEAFARMAVVNVLSDGRYDTMPPGGTLPASRFQSVWRFFPGRDFIHVAFEIHGVPGDEKEDRLVVTRMWETKEPGFETF